MAAQSQIFAKIRAVACWLLAYFYLIFIERSSAFRVPAVPSDTTKQFGADIFVHHPRHLSDCRRKERDARGSGKNRHSWIASCPRQLRLVTAERGGAGRAKEAKHNSGTVAPSTSGYKSNLLPAASTAYRTATETRTWLAGAAAIEHSGHSRRSSQCARSAHATGFKSAPTCVGADLSHWHFSHCLTGILVIGRLTQRRHRTLAT